MNIIAERPELGLYEDMERDDDARGPETEPEAAVFWQLVQRFVLAPVCGEPAGQCSVCGGWFEGWCGGVCDACRPLQEEGMVRAQGMPEGDEDDACPLCGCWSCDC